MDVIFDPVKRVSVWRPAIVLIALVAIGCRSSDIVQIQPGSAFGMYVLTSIQGRPVPTVFLTTTSGDSVTTRGDTLTLASDSTYSLAQHHFGTQSGASDYTDTGRYTLFAGQLSLFSSRSSGGATLTGAYQDGEIRLSTIYGLWDFTRR